MILLPPHSSILFIESDPHFNSLFASDPTLRATHSMCASSTSQALSFLSSPDYRFRAVVLSSSLSVEQILEVVRGVHRAGYGMKLIFRCNGNKAEPASPLDQEELAALGFSLVVAKDQTPVEIVKSLAIDPKYMECFDALPGTTEYQEEWSQDEKAEYLPMACHLFMSGHKLEFELSVRLETDKYFPIVKKGETFSPDRMIRYLLTGISTFYIRSAVRKQYLEFCETLARKTLEKTLSPHIELAIQPVIHFGAETLGFLRDAGVKAESLKFAERFVELTDLLIRKLHLDAHPKVEALLHSVAHREHSVSTAVITGLIARQLGFQSEQVLRIIGLSAFLHDIGLNEILPSDFPHGDPFALGKFDTVLCADHPEKGAVILEEIKTLDRAIPQAIRQHHERRNNKGFPGLVSVGTIAQAAEIVGLADECTQVFIHTQNKLETDWRSKLKDETFDGFSFSVIDALSKGLNLT